MWLLALAWAGCGDAAPHNAPPGTTVRLAVDVHGVQRSYLLTLPKSYGAYPGQRYPVVFGFHGFGGDANGQAASDGFAATAAHGQLIAVHPEGSYDPPESWKGRVLQGWSAVGSSMTSGAADDLCSDREEDEFTWPCSRSCGTCSRCSYAPCADDVGFVEELLTELDFRLCIDPARIFAHGFSNGGMMVLQLLQSHLAPRFAALVTEVALPHAGRLQLPKAHPRFLGLWGDSDPTMPSRGGSNSEGFLYSSAPNVTRTLAHAYGCSAFSRPVTTRVKRNGLRCEEYHCPVGAEVVQCFFSGGHDRPKFAHNLLLQFYFGDFRADPADSGAPARAHPADYGDRRLLRPAAHEFRPAPIMPHDRTNLRRPALLAEEDADARARGPRLRGA